MGQWKTGARLYFESQGLIPLYIIIIPKFSQPSAHPNLESLPTAVYSYIAKALYSTPQHLALKHAFLRAEGNSRRQKQLQGGRLVGPYQGFTVINLFTFLHFVY